MDKQPLNGSIKVIINSKRCRTTKKRRPTINTENLVRITSKNDKNLIQSSERLFSFGLLNARSAKQQDRTNNKPMEIHDLIADNDIDILAITETWLRDDGRDQVAIGDMTPTGYRIQHCPRKKRRGGGLAIIYRDDLKINTITPLHFDTFECFRTQVFHQKVSFHLAVVYRPTQGSTPKFLEEFSSLTESLSIHTNHIIMGDFNFPVNIPDHTDGSKMINFIDCSNYVQHVKTATHENGHILDLILSPSTSLLQPTMRTIDRTVSSDHFTVICDMLLPKPQRKKRKIWVRKWSSVNAEAFNTDISNKQIAMEDPITSYNSILKSLIELHAPTRSITITERPSTPWYNVEIRHSKTICRALERKWLKTKLTVDHQIFKSQRNRIKQLRDKAKREYICTKLTDATTTKDTYSILNDLLHKPVSKHLPSHDSTSELAERFASYFTDKISAVRSNFDNNNVLQGSNSNSIAQLDCFQFVQQDELKKLIARSPSKSCALDPVPTWLVKSCPALVPLLCDIINSSISSGTVPPALKYAYITPALKRPSLDENQLKNYRPISNLPFTAKLTERVISKRLERHCEEHNINSHFQSAYKKHHSTETALLRVQNDLLMAVDRSGGAILILLDLSAAFDTIDHRVMLDTLHSTVGVTGTALKWFSSYLSNRYQSVKIGETISTKRPLLFGVPQGSVLGPQLFSIYTLPLQTTIQDCGMSFHLYADDTQLYIAFNPRSEASSNDVTSIIHNTTNVINNWMRSHFLKLNSDKTEVLVMTKPSIKSDLIPHVNINESIINTSPCVKDLGVCLDSHLRMEDQIRAICKRAYYQLHLIGKVRQFISEDACRTLVQVNVTSHLDYCNCLLAGLPANLIGKLQRVQNCAARMIKQIGKYDHITPVLKDLHWLPIKFRIDYKVLVITFKVLNGLAPAYLKELLQPYTPSRRLRSADDNLLCTNSYRCATYGGRSFAVMSPQLWNALPSFLRKFDSLSSFKRALKTHLFTIAFA
jgi:hypothetical protein